MEKKKFRINVIDIIILVLIVCVAVFAVLKFSDGGVQQATAQDKVQIVYFIEECADYVVESTQIGDPVYDSTAENNMGVVTGIEVGEPVGYKVMGDATSTPVIRENYYSVKITTETYGTMTDHGVIINGTLYGVGHTMVIHAGQGKYYLRIFSLETLPG